MHIKQIDHIGIRVMDFDRGIRFYKQLGFEVRREHLEEHVVVIKHPSGIELNLLDSGNDNLGGNNILMDVEQQYPGYTHFALQVASVMDTKRFLESLNITITEGPVRFGDNKTSIFIRDPDRNVIEFTELPQA